MQHANCRWMAVAAALLAIPSCKSEGAASGGGLRQLCEDNLAYQCEVMFQCAPQDFAFGSVEQCAQALGAGCEAASVTSFPSIEGIGTGFDLSGDNLEALSACLAAQQSLGPSCRPNLEVDEATLLAAREACDLSGLLSGSLGQGERCRSQVFCGEGLACVGIEDATCGTCEPLVEGLACEGGDGCGFATGFYCDESNRCRAHADDGESCADRSCRPERFLYCGTDGLCHPQRRLGESCAGGESCDAGLYLFCSESSGQTCQREPSDGEPCPDAVCGPGLFCDPDAMTCRSLLGEGESCAGSLGTACDPILSLMCDPATSTCVSSFAKAGERCSESGLPDLPSDCWQSYCAQTSPDGSGVCTAYGQDGDPCSDDGSIECADFLVCWEGVCRIPAEVFPSGAGAPPDGSSEVDLCE